MRNIRNTRIVKFYPILQKSLTNRSSMNITSTGIFGPDMWYLIRSGHHLTGIIIIQHGTGIGMMTITGPVLIGPIMAGTVITVLIVRVIIIQTGAIMILTTHTGPVITPPGLIKNDPLLIVMR